MTRGRLGRRTATGLVLLLLFAGGVPARSLLRPPPETGGVALGLVLRRLNVTTRVLYITAHPDDENNGLLVRLSRGQGARTALLCLTRGEGGQNAIGRELGEALAVLRTAELDAVHRFDGVTQLFGRARDFGLSFSVEESLETWGHEATLADVVRVVREFRPDVLVTLPPESPGGGQHHQATSRLALEAFRAAADPQRFPEQLEKGLTSFQPRKIYATGTGGGGEGLEAPLLRLSTGQFDPLLGGTWAEMGFAARTEHRSQGAGVGPVPTSGGEAVLSLLDALPAVTGRETDLTDGIGARLVDLVRFVPPGVGANADALRSGLVGLEAHIEAARATFDVREPSRTIAALGRAASAVDALLEGLGTLPRVAQVELALRLGDTRRDLHLALTLAHGLSLTASVDDKEVVRGQTVGVTMTAVHHGPEPLEIVRLIPAVPDGWMRSGSRCRYSPAPGARRGPDRDLHSGCRASGGAHDALLATS